MRKLLFATILFSTLNLFNVDTFARIAPPDNSGNGSVIGDDGCIMPPPPGNDNGNGDNDGGTTGPTDIVGPRPPVPPGGNPGDNPGGNPGGDPGGNPGGNNNGYTIVPGDPNDPPEGAIDGYYLHPNDWVWVVPKKKDCECDDGSTGSSKSDNKCVYYSISFGHFPAHNGLPSGKLLIESKKMNPLLYTSGIIRYDHPIDQHIIKVSTVSGQRQVEIRYNGIYTVAYRFDASGFARAAGTTSGYGSQLRMLNANFEPITSGTPAYYEEITTSRQSIRYSAETYKVVAIKSANGSWVEVSAMAIDIVRDSESGAIAQIYNPADGLINVVTLGDSSFRIEWYAPENVGEKNGATGRYTFSENPVKQWTLSNPSPNAKSNKQVRIVEQRGEFVFENLWTYYDQLNDWVLRRGTGPDATEEIKQIVPTSDGYEEIVTLRSIDGKVARKSKEVYKVFSFGERLVTSIEDFGGLNRTTTYEYDNSGNPSRTISPNNVIITREYDTSRRMTKETRPSVYGNEVTTYTYSGDYDPRVISKITTIGGTEVSRTVYTYDENPADNPYGNGTGSTKQVNTTTVATTANGVTHTTVTERHSSAADELLAGRMKLSRNTDGTETAYSYTALDNGGYRQIVTRQANGAVVPGLSTRNISDYNASGELTREESYVHTGSDFELVSWVNNTYNPAHKIIRSEYSDGTVSTADYICKGPIWTIDRNGIRTDYFYDTAKRQYKTVRQSPHGAQTTENVLDAASRVVSTTVSAGELSQTTSREYDRAGRLVKSVDAGGYVTTYAYSADELVTTVTNPAGATQISTTAATGETVSVTGTGVTPQYYAYAMSNGLRKQTVYVGSQNSPRWNASYSNGFGQMVKSEQPGFGGSTITTNNIYNAIGQMTASQTTGQPTVTYEYNAFGNQVKSTVTGDGVSRIQQQVTAYVSEDNVVWQKTTGTVSTSDTSIAPIVTSNKQQLSGLSNVLRSKMVSVDARGNASTSWTSYIPSEYKTTTYQTQPGIATSATSVAIDGRTMSSTDFAGVTTTMGYDALGRVVSQTDGRGNTTTITYNEKGERSQVIDAASAVTEYSYDQAGRLTAVKDAMGKYTRYAYDIKGQKVAEYGDNTYPLIFEYDIYGQRTAHYTFRLADNLTSQPSAAEGDRTQYAYDPATGLLLANTFADNNATTYTYDSLGRLSRRTWARGVTTDYTYDAFGQLLTTEHSDAYYATTYEYNAMGQIAEVSEEKGLTSFAYNEYGEPVEESTLNIYGIYDKIITRHYDEYGRNNGYSIDSERKATYCYGHDGKMIGMDIGADSEFSFGYLPNTHMRNAIIYPNSVTKTMNYEQNRNLVNSISHSAVNNSVSTYTYVNDQLGRRTSITSSFDTTNKIVNYNYNDRSEVIYAERENDPLYQYFYDYDNIGNRKSASENSTSMDYQTNQLNQYTAAGDDFLPTFDADGNQTTIKTSTGIWSVEYDGENRPAIFTNTVSGHVIFCYYDYMGRRWQKVGVDAMWNFTIFSHYHYLGYQQIEETNEFGTFLKSFVWDPLAGTPLVATIGNRTHYYTHDANKNVTELTASDGTVSAHYEYSPFGAVTAAVGSFANTNPYRFSSEYLDTELGLVYYNYRHCNPSTGRWLSRDPISEQGGYNLYGFVGNNAILLNDYLGLKWSIFRYSTMEYATAKAQPGDTIKDLADAIGLKHEEFDKWGTTKSIFANTRTPCEVEIPNTIYSYWAGNGGVAGRLFISWNANNKKFQKNDYYVKEVHVNWNTPKYEYANEMIKLSSEKKLYGTYFWGHGNSQILATNPTLAEKLAYPDIDLMHYKSHKILYTIRYAFMFACESESSKASIPAKTEKRFIGLLNPFTDDTSVDL